MRNKKGVNQFVIIFLIILFGFGYGQNVRAEGLETHNNSEIKKVNPEGKKLEIGKLIIEHITDAYDWHILSMGKHHVTVPLPVILYDQGHWVTFWSSEFHHHTVYKGYTIAEKGINQGKIVRIDKAGNLVRPQLDISITRTIAALMVNSLLVVILLLSVAKSYRRRKGMAPKGLQSAFEPLIIFVRDEIALSSIGEKNYERYTPYLLTLFFFIFFNNLLGIIPFFPWGVSVNGNIAITGVMAAFTFVITTFIGNKHYWKDIFNTPGVPWWLKLPFPLLPLVEVVGIFTKPIVLMIRLFANMISGHTVIMGFVALIFIFGKISMGLGYGVSVVSIGFSVFLDFIEILVAFIQAYVFVLLTALYFGMAIEVPEHH